MSSPDDGFAFEVDAYLHAQKQKVEAEEQQQQQSYNESAVTADESESSSSRYLYNQDTDQWYDVITGEYSRFDSTLQQFMPVTPPPMPNQQLQYEDEQQDNKKSIIMHLVVLKSNLLTQGQIVIVDSEEGLTVGRDRSWFDRRLRLAELPVSKYHCQIYYHHHDIDKDQESDDGNGGFHVIDMGSRNGTFLNNLRLSGTKSSSVPAKLNHLDQLLIGSTLFEIHQHGDNQGQIEACCSKCSLSDDNLSKLVDMDDGVRKEDDHQLQQQYYQRDTLAHNMDFKSSEHKEQEWMQKLRRLKRSYASSVDSKNNSSNDDTNYVDAAGRRRRLYASTTSPSYLNKRQIEKQIDNDKAETYVTTQQNTLQTPVQGIGNTMLQKMGWQQGQALGKDGKEGILAPISPMTQLHRGGLGSSSSSPNIQQDPSSKQLHRYQITKQRYYDQQ
ncbi:hypothetical protein BDA99DRAFT_529597 [Phascolomyces articulosus]|uniref:Uncharacterized protein n=1 Tax=Phascolomyces articulosus TaxID=60185 RepID=A0AAD5P765_9FUNG|nr:hypothetical protein BDA99DRAFT_529597 [Phascolomyces articulosus]